MFVAKFNFNFIDRIKYFFEGFSNMKMFNNTPYNFVLNICTSNICTSIPQYAEF